MKSLWSFVLCPWSWAVPSHFSTKDHGPKTKHFFVFFYDLEVRVTSRLWLWYVPALVGLSAAAVFGVGFWLALRGTAGEPLGSAPPAPASSRIATPPARPAPLLSADPL